MKFFLYLKDKRLPYVEGYLKQRNFLTKAFDEQELQEIQKGDFVILSPAYKWSESVVINMSSNITIFAGNISEEHKQVKRFYSENGKVRLHPENKNMKDIYPEQCSILGIVVGLIRTEIK